MKNFIPFAHAKSVYEIEIDFYKKCGVKTLLLDLDNTLDSYKLRKPTEKAKALITKLQNSNLKVVIVSNNRKSRVEGYANECKADFISKAFKPFPFKINKFIKSNCLSKDEIMFVGDQLMTDVLAANRAKIRVVLTEKIVKEDQPTTRINRLFDRPIRKHLNKKGLLKDWKKIGEEIC